ncbi:VgrG-related protein [Streptomyces lacrimifluminis]|uniref:Type IV secretion protein Rhs n=1 Tax=Streptomyces lacrimifluminis TaxID=1500077 RepID=A0A917P6Q8_9ACTN|nr:VgrG-related protein [Streptomyces lacrimifluminis]GGJ64448.1 type IV secretion protein Rhs [Streptomyces lacrimifluminis]
MTTEARGRLFAADPVVGTPAELPQVWAAQLVSCVVDENVGLPDAAQLTFRDPDHEFLRATGITIGTPLNVSVVTVSGKARERLFNGEVTALELDRDSTGAFTVVRAYSKAHRLQRGRKVVAYQNMTASAIVRKVAAGAGLACGTVDAGKITYKQLSQANVSDWDFLQFLAAESGALVRVDDKGLLQFTKPVKASGAPAPSTSSSRNPMVLEYGANLLALRASLSAADGASQVEVRGWDVTTKKPLVSPKASVNSETVLPGLSPAFAARFGKSKLTVTDTPYRTLAETTAVADAVADHVSSGFAELEAVAEGNPQLRAGKPVALGNVGQAFSGKYTATAVRHVLEPHGGYRTTVWVSASPDRSLTGLVIGAGAPGRGSRMPGLAIGVVTDVHETGAESGSVKLKFPWLDDTYTTDWVRTVQWGGKGGGGVFSPEVNDEVLVGFEQGLLDSPYVIGGLYNGVDKPSPHEVPLIDKATGKVNRRSIVSRSGHRVELLDQRAPGLSGVRLTSADERLVVFVDDRRNSIQLSVYARRTSRQPLSSVLLDAKGITLDAGSGDVTISGGKVDIQATAGVRIGGATVGVEGTANVTVNGGGRGVFKAAIIEIN